MAHGDLDRVMEIAAGLKTAPQWARAAYAAAVDSGEMPRRVALVAEEDGDGMGFCVAVVVVVGQAELESICVDGAAQGRGIGGALLRELILRLRAEGVRELGLEVRESNLAARKLYEKAGFREAGWRRGYYRDPVEDALLMEAVVGGRESAG